jgi:hypothetical protein
MIARTLFLLSLLYLTRVSAVVLLFGRDDTINVTVNGVLQNNISHVTPHSGRIGFQLEGIPCELRAVRLTPL